MNYELAKGWNLVATRLVQVGLGEGSVWVEAVVPPGSEETAGPTRVAERVLEAFDAAETVMTDLAVRVAGSVAAMQAREADPDEVSVEFGLKVSTTGSVIVASGSAEAALAVRVVYKRRSDGEGVAGLAGVPGGGA